MKQNVSGLLAIGILCALPSGGVLAATAEDICESSKLGTSAKYASCRLKADSKAAKAGTSADYSKCNLEKFASAEDKAGMGVCPTEADQTTVKDYLDDCTSTAALWLAGGGGLPDTCDSDLATCEADLSSCESSPSSIPLKTGQSTCYSGGGAPTACGGTGQDGEFQAGSPRSYTNNGDGTITDNATGLMWEVLTDDGSIHDKDTLHNWANAFAVKIAGLNAANFAGHNDWRLPNRFELETLFDLSGSGAAAVNAAFDTNCSGGCTAATCSCTAADYHWSSTTRELLNYGTRITFSDGTVDQEPKATGSRVRAVRGTSETNCVVAGLPSTGQTTTYGAGSDGDLEKGQARLFTDNGDGTITDNTTGLMWEKKSDDGSIHDQDNTYTWSTGTNNMDGTMVTTFLAMLNGGGGFAGYTDWRIPNLNELESLRNVEVVGPATYTEFNDTCSGGCTVTTCSCTQSGGHWSSSTNQGVPDYAWYVYFDVGGTGASSKTHAYYVRAVRAGS